MQIVITKCNQMTTAMDSFRIWISHWNVLLNLCFDKNGIPLTFRFSMPFIVFFFHSFVFVFKNAVSRTNNAFVNLNIYTLSLLIRGFSFLLSVLCFRFSCYFVVECCVYIFLYIYIVFVFRSSSSSIWIGYSYVEQQKEKRNMSNTTQNKRIITNTLCTRQWLDMIMTEGVRSIQQKPIVKYTNSLSVSNSWTCSAATIIYTQTEKEKKKKKKNTVC